MKHSSIGSVRNTSQYARISFIRTFLLWKACFLTQWINVSRRTTCLKYLVLANMLMKSAINPFDSQEAKPYKNDPEIHAMTRLVRLVSGARLRGALGEGLARG